MSDKPLIIGAGPVGLAAALFLARQGVAARIIDKLPQPSPHSKALVVNPRTLAILESTGITDQMLAVGRRINGARFWHDGKIIAEFPAARLGGKYPFLLALSQAATERLLAEAFLAAGGTIEREVELFGCRNVAQGVEANLGRAGQQSSERVAAPWLLAADGARSVIRHQMNVDFPGSSFAEPFYLVDASISLPLAPDWAHIAFLDGGGFTFAVRVIDPALPSGDAPVWRMMSDRPDPVAQFPQAKVIGPVLWQSNFHISHRIDGQMRVGQVYFAGDAAHIHSPIGARGMNLGLEDAWVFSELVRRGQLDRYHELRHPVDEAVVKRIETISKLAMGRSAVARMARLRILPPLTHLPPVKNMMLRTVTGLDHELPF